MNFGEKVLELVNKHGITKNKMLTDLGINHGAFVDWIKKDQIPNGVNVAKIAKYFNVSTDFLLGNTDDPTPPNKKDYPTTQQSKIMLKQAILNDDELSEESKQDLIKQMELLKLRDKVKIDEDDDPQTFKIAARGGANKITLNREQRKEFIESAEKALKERKDKDHSDIY